MWKFWKRKQIRASDPCFQTKRADVSKERLLSARLLLLMRKQCVPETKLMVDDVLDFEDAKKKFFETM
jgi:hypothetical protein